MACLARTESLTTLRMPRYGACYGEAVTQVAIGPGFRVALAAKAALLVVLGVTIGSIGLGAVLRESSPIAIVAVIACVPLAGFAFWAASLGLSDAVTGAALSESGPIRHLRRERGVSMRLASGRVVEYILWNPWERLDAEKRYEVTYGARSGVIAKRPVLLP